MKRPYLLLIAAYAAHTFAVAETATAPALQKWILSEDSNVEFTGHKVGGKQDGSFFLFAGSFEYDGNSFEGGKLYGSVEMDSLITKNDGLTSALKGPKFLDAKKYPEGTFASEKIIKKGENYEVTGHFTFIGKAVKTTFPAMIVKAGDQVSIKANFEINRQDWGMTYKGIGEHVMRDNIDVRFDLVFDPPKS